MKTSQRCSTSQFEVYVHLIIQCRHASYIPFLFSVGWNVSRLLELNSHTTIWWQLSVLHQERDQHVTLRARTLYGCVLLPTSCIIHQLDDKRPAGDDSCSSRKEVSVAEEEAIWRRTRTHNHTKRPTTSLYCQANLHLWSRACQHYSGAF